MRRMGHLPVHSSTKGSFTLGLRDHFCAYKSMQRTRLKNHNDFSPNDPVSIVSRWLTSVKSEVIEVHMSTSILVQIPARIEQPFACACSSAATSSASPILSTTNTWAASLGFTNGIELHSACLLDVWGQMTVLHGLKCQILLSVIVWICQHIKLFVTSTNLTANVLHPSDVLRVQFMKLMMIALVREWKQREAGWDVFDIAEYPFLYFVFVIIGGVARSLQICVECIRCKNS